MVDQSEELRELQQLLKSKADELATVKTTLESTILKQTNELGLVRSKLTETQENVRAAEEAVEEEHQMLVEVIKT